jgi:hypothetical protein
MLQRTSLQLMYTLVKRIEKYCKWFKQMSKVGAFGDLTILTY